MSNINLTLTEQELETVISGLLFSCSVNVVSNTDLGYQEQLLNVATKLKDIKPDIKLHDIQFVQEQDYEDLISEKVLTNFKENLEITSFDCV
jgi:enoyl-[acyl-carrier-protein] reductase (NADH)